MDGTTTGQGIARFIIGMLTFILGAFLTVLLPILAEPAWALASIAVYIVGGLLMRSEHPVPLKGGMVVSSCAFRGIIGALLFIFPISVIAAPCTYYCLFSPLVITCSWIFFWLNVAFTADSVGFAVKRFLSRRESMRGQARANQQPAGEIPYGN